MTVLVYGKPDCADYARARATLTRSGIEYTFIDIVADPAAAADAERLSGDARSPVLLLPDGSVRVEPTDEELDELVVLLIAGRTVIPGEL